ncbi:MAG: B12-binding domain-containing radical SAM protein [Desulfobacterales bacterium]|nr:B12-binding domain-containing radical SAM protein [Desulfobacterales bacterium]
MRALLVNPYYPIDETPSPPLGLAFIAAVLERAGLEVKILDYVVFPYSRAVLAAEIKIFQPAILGLTAVTMTFENAIAVVQAAKAINPDIITVMGGPHVTFRARKTLVEHPELDVIVLGEGEETIVDLTRAIENEQNWHSIKGLVFRNGPEIVDTGHKPPGINVDTLPLPARHLLPLGRYRALNLSISMTTSRGCPFKCIFCIGRKMVGAKVRYRAPVKVVDEMESLAAYGFNQINLADDLFTANAGHCTAVCEEIIKRRLKIKWTSFARVDTVSLEVLEKMKAAGCTAVSFGVETGSPATLKTIRKGITLEQVVAAVKLCTRAGLQPHASFILGLPGETEQTLQETLAFGEQLEKLGVAYGFHLLAPFPGTEVRENCDAYGIKITTNDWRRYHANRAIVKNAGIQPEVLDKVAADWMQRFDLWLGDVEKRMATGQAQPDEVAQVVNLKRTVLIYDLMMGRLVEAHGNWPLAAEVLSESARIDELAETLAPHVKNPSAEIVDTLHHALQSGALAWEVAKGEKRLRWVDYL